MKTHRYEGHRRSRPARLAARLVFLALVVLPLLPATDARAAERAPASARVAERGFAGEPLERERAARIAIDAGVQLIDARPCPGRRDRCALFAVRGDAGGAVIYRVSAERCEPAGAAGCFGGYAVESVTGGKTGKPGRSSSPASAAKVSAKPGEDGAPPDPQDEAQAEATNEIIEALGDGKYEGDYDAFWRDLESIQSWDMPSWREPDPPPPDTIEGIPLPSALDDCRPERRALERNESRCDAPALTVRGGAGGSSCPASLLPPFTPETDNLSIANWDWSLDRFVYFAPHDADPTEEDVDLLAATWNFLVDNADIAEWVVCLVEGRSNGNCIDKRLDGDVVQPYEFVEELPLGCPSNAGMCTAFIGRKTHIKLSSWRPDTERFFRAGQSDTEKLCILARNASVLLHEMLHSCLAPFTQNADDFGVGPGECGCDTPDMAEAAFAWAVAQRYPCLLHSNGCDFYGDDEMWLTPCDFGYNCPPLCG